MIGIFESMVRMYPERACFTFVDESGQEERYTYRQTRLIAAGLARRLQDAGVQRGDCVALDLPNCPAFVFLLLAAAYASFAIVPVNYRLTPAEKQARLMELERLRGVRLSCRIDKRRAEKLVSQVKDDLMGRRAGGEGQARAGRPWQLPSFRAQRTQAPSAPSAGGRRGRVIMGARQDAEEEAIHFAERQAHLFDDEALALVMFTSGTTGKSKAVPLTWRQLASAAQASNAALSRPAEGLWQAALPLYHIGGLQVVVRSVMNRNPFLLYARFDANRVLNDARSRHATHVSVVDKMLQDLLAVGDAEALQGYRCILLGGGALNRRTLARALSAKARVYASYGMTETSSQIAHGQVDDGFRGGLRLLPGYRARIVDANAEGYGRLAVSGPGVFSGYLNARAAFTVDGYFLTGDVAAFEGGRLYVKERTADMFVSGGENVYPAEIVDKLVRVPGVADAYVFGAPDATWGRRPVAFVERERVSQAGGAGAPTQDLVQTVYAALRPNLSKIYLPQHIFAVDELPRTGIGKIDRAAAERLYEQRIEVKRVNLYHVRLPFVRPFKTAKATLNARDSLIVEVVDHAGRTGLGECVAFATDWYLPETLEHDATVLQRFLIPRVLARAYLHPREAAEALNGVLEAAAFPLARGALEPALWDLYGKIVGKPLWKLVREEAARMGMAGVVDGGRAGGTGAAFGGDAAPATGGAGAAGPEQAAAGAGGAGGEPAFGAAGASGAGAVLPRVGTSAKVAAGAVVGLGTPQETVEAARRCVEAGYRRVKLKVAPGSAACVRAVRQAFPQLVITLDANQSFGERDWDELRALDACGAAWMEEPLDVGGLSARGRGGAFEQLARLQRSLATPICLDESFVRPEDAYRALEHPELRCFAVKVGKFGGVLGALEFVRAAQARGARVWMGGMYDTGISKRVHAAFQTLPGMDVPGDVGATSRYFPVDVTDPPYSVERGTVTLNREGHPFGLGCDLCRSTLANVLVKRIVIE